MFARQQKCTPVSTTLRPLLDDSPLNTSLNNGGILGSSVFCAVFRVKE
jgi:hypothetical protein